MGRTPTRRRYLKITQMVKTTLMTARKTARRKAEQEVRLWYLEYGNPTAN
jgi:hypothetical protein